MRDMRSSWQCFFPEKILGAINRITACRKAVVYAAGGVVRDFLLKKTVRDIDLVVSPEPFLFARDLATCLNAPMFVLDEQQQVARIAWETEIDVSGFRSASLSIKEDLLHRDFTINAMALPFPVKDGGAAADFGLIDPYNGGADLRDKVIRIVSPTCFSEDPLRLLRAYRFAATLHFSIEEETARQIVSEKSRIGQSAPERIKYEMDLLFSAPNSAEVLRQMQQSGLLFELFPLLRDMDGVRQPLSHHLDVLNHSLATLQCLESVLADPVRFFPGDHSIDKYLQDQRKKVLLKWAAIWHDCGKPQAREESADRITFYNHDRCGAALFQKMADHYRWSRKDTALVGGLIAGHMWPFHLNNVYRQQKISKRACLRLAKRFKLELPGLFLLAMADSLAGEGPEKPAGIEVSLAALYREIDRIYRQELSLKMASPPIVTGHDLIKTFSLPPGPLFKEILDEIRDAQLCGELVDRQQALQRVTQILENRGLPFRKTSVE